MEKNVIQRILKFCVFMVITNLPFITISQLIGIDTFIDSFHHPESYLYIQNERIETPCVFEGYIILEKPINQEYLIKQGDTILYYSQDNSIQQKAVSQIVYLQGMKTYYTTSDNKAAPDGPIYDQQIIGTVKGTIDETIWNALCLHLWDLSRNTLNIISLFPRS